ncbi:MAG: Succinyl-CoA ligase (ADP-forming) subunit alpha [Syntrophaceae bacterium PtaU1.Bin231]|nr:MAG: Succinyl-CoA ligase (ADP-forming) subunit alpha [Syntrophaceae bacterium PtaU1.Bin231]HOG16128.1 succinate--CoA ligase subunit alpha [Syntrophales bacterium]
MAILLKKETRVLVQGITGREGSARAVFMRGVGTNVVAGVTPGRGGDEVSGIPVYNTVEEAVRAQGHFDVSVTFVPGTALKEAVFEALDAGIRWLVMPVERVPLYDILEIVAYGKQKNAMLLGPGTIGIHSPGIGTLGWLGGSVENARNRFVPGHVGVISRSGGQSGTLPWTIKVAGMGVSTVIHVGTEPVTGMSTDEILPYFQEDEQTHAVVMFGEIGGTQEEEAADIVRAGKFTKPLVVYVAGAWAPPGMRFSHASSIVERGRGSAKDKINYLREAGIHVVDRPDELATTVKRLLKLS